ncbi:Late embryogenesis abundant protein [Sesbania bispinosa]|nr:Late embryogenesis abundant protein [Sesbania bispinosa]
MSQEQPRRGEHEEPIKYGEVFNVSGELASKPITPRDAATMQSAESQVLGQTQRGGPAAMMESAAAINERAGLVSHHAVTNLARNQGVTVTAETNETDNNKRLIRETLGGQVVGQFVQAGDAPKGTRARDPLESTVDEGDPYPASTQAPQVRAAQDYDFVSNQGAGTLNPRFSGNQENNTQSNVATDKGETNENPEVINSVPGGMGASMATIDRVKKNK